MVGHKRERVLGRVGRAVDAAARDFAREAAQLENGGGREAAAERLVEQQVEVVALDKCTPGACSSIQQGCARRLLPTCARKLLPAADPLPPGWLRSDARIRSSSRSLSNQFETSLRCFIGLPIAAAAANSSGCSPRSMACAAATSRQSAFLDLIRVASLSAATAAFAPASAIPQRQRRTHCGHPPFAAAFGARASSKDLLRLEAKWGFWGRNNSHLAQQLMFS